jgi:tetratricopeptide (TPR) repeat protein
MKFLIFFLIFLINQSCFASNDFICGYNNSDEIEFCDYITKQSYVGNNIFHESIENMMNSIALPQNFILVECDNINNAYAYSRNGVRYIIIDSKWIKNFHSQNWFVLSVIAHEIGHHLCGHSIHSTNLNNQQKRNRELEADKFSGYLLKTINSNLEDALTGINNLIPIEIDDSHSTHPSRLKRIKAVTEGFNNQMFNQNNAILNKETSESLLNKSISIVEYPSLYTSKSIIESAMIKCEESLELDPNNADALFRAGILWYFYALKFDSNLKIDFLGFSLKSYFKYLKIYPNSSGAYSNIGLIYCNLGFINKDYNFYQKAISNLNISIKLDPLNSGAYLNRGIAYLNIGYNWHQPTKPYYCNDFYKSCQLGDDKGCEEYRKACKNR